MTDRATPNLPARSFDATADFYSALGFEIGWKDEGWMILERGDVTLEFFAYPALDPAQSNFSCCIRLDDLDAMVETVSAAGIPTATAGMPRIHPPRLEDTGIRIAYLIDPDGTLLRLIQND